MSFDDCDVQHETLQHTFGLIIIFQCMYTQLIKTNSLSSKPIACEIASYTHVITLC